ncbi:MAG: TIGR01212 family radical SAM protein [Thermotogae bacterium]|nr:MAG: TIGR01212 family radical SAM protein [Thermotogota bacterium]
MERYRKLSRYLKEKYGCRVHRITIEGGFTCPNRERGNPCIFCDPTGSGFNTLRGMSIKAQALAQIERAKKKYGAKKFIAYFQEYTNTYAPSDVLRERYSEAIVDDVVQLSVSTRPDCVSQDVLDVLNEFKNRVEVSVELGLQSANYRTLMILKRGHTLADFIDAVLRCKKNGLEVIAHVIVDLPWDDQLDVLETARILSALGVDGVKIHTLYVVKGTELERMVQNGLNLLSFEEFVERICIFLENLSSDIVIHRLVSDPPKGMTLLGNWNMSKMKILNILEQEFEKRDLHQGSKFPHQSILPS